MKLTCLLTSFLLFSLTLFAQAPTFNFTKPEVEAQLKYIASDELGGRRTASVGEKMAADYIVNQLKAFGVKPVPGQADYFQQVPFYSFVPPKSGKLTIEQSEFNVGDNLLVMNKIGIDTTAEIVFVNNGWVDAEKGIDDYKGLDVKGKIVLTVIGTPEGNSPAQVFESMEKKQKFAAEHGAIALLETYRMPLPWHISQNYFGKERMEIQQTSENSEMPYVWVKEQSPNILLQVKDKTKVKAKLKIVAGDSKSLMANNIIGIIEGADPNLKNEYVLLSAHYDHVGVGKQGGAAYTAQDSIFNGARDNGMGVVALLSAAKDFAAHPPKRSVLLLACTAEEMGMLGSQWYADHPLLPLEKMVFNLNNDGAGYNSKAHFNIIGLAYTNADAAIKQAGEQVGLTMLGDPDPSQGLYERSDNISFARGGIPAVDMAPGITEMGDEIFHYYHQAVDNPESVDIDYLLKFCQAYTLAARKIADMDGKIEWIGEGKVFEKK